MVKISESSGSPKAFIYEVSENTDYVAIDKIQELHGCNRVG